MRWRCEEDEVRGARRLRLWAGDAPLSVDDVLTLWAGDEVFRSFYLDWLRALPFEAARWEHPALTPATLGDRYACVAHDAPELRVPADASAFAEHFSDAPVVRFTNLSGDATLIVPTPRGPAGAYAHLLAFVRGAPEEQRHALLAGVAAATRARLGPRPAWLSTAGAGVAWLHVRLDDRPKYYRHAPYRQLG